MKHKIIYIIIAIIILSIISGCGVQNIDSALDGLEGSQEQNEEFTDEPYLNLAQEPTPEPMTASPAAYIEGGIKIGGDKSIIEGVYFDSDYYEEYGSEEYFAYLARPEMEEVGGPQTEIDESGFSGNIG